MLKRKLPSGDVLFCETEAYYIPGVDRTVVFQEVYVQERRYGQPDYETVHIQTNVLGWYYGEPSDESTKQFAQSTLTATYL